MLQTAAKVLLGLAAVVLATASVAASATRPAALPQATAQAANDLQRAV